MVLSGGFALTYTITTPQRQLAVRCFHREIPAADHKYSAISRHVESVKSKYFVTFSYLKQGIRVKQAVYPIVKMAWVEGDPLGIWLDKNAANSAVVEKLREQFAALAAFLNQNGIAHGDIQNGNVMVSPSGVTLIDYDGMYVPGMATGNGSETGHKHFQHPSREASHFGPMMDRFSFIVLDLSLRAITHDVSLHRRFREGGETIIFRANDFIDLQHSEVFQILRQRPKLKPFTDNFARICEADIRSVPTLEDFLAGRNIPSNKPITSRSKTDDLLATVPQQAHYIGAYPVFSTSDYAGVLRMMGQRIELVGCIQAVRHGTGKRGKGRGKPYVFVNFGFWRGDIVKLTIWSEGLAQLSDWPDERWVGRWVSVVGLVDAPYSGKHYNFHYTHVGITIDNSHQINVISEGEAKFRLGQSFKTPVQPAAHVAKPDKARNGAGSSNQSIISSLTGKSASRQTAPARATASSRQNHPRSSSNQDILRLIQRGPIPPAPAASSSPLLSRPTALPPLPVQPSLLRRMLRLIGLGR
jgi:hypothetical protein